MLGLQAPVGFAVQHRCTRTWNYNQFDLCSALSYLKTHETVKNRRVGPVATGVVPQSA